MQTFTRFLALAAIAVAVAAETHTVTFTNNCGHGTPTLVQSGNTLSTGGAYTSNGPLESCIAYLQTGSCGLNGEGCTMVEFTLVDGGNSADVTLVPPHTFSVTSGFGYYGTTGSCSGRGADCTSASCCPTDAFCSSTDYAALRNCQDDNVNLAITFCD